MFKMSHSCYHHRQVIGFAIRNRIIVTDGTAGLNKCRDAGLMPKHHTIIEREKSIAGHNGAMQVKIELSCFFKGLPQGINPAGLPAAFADQLFVFYQGNGI